MKTIYFKISFFLLLLFGLFSCKSITSNRMFETPDDFEYTEFSKSTQEYVIQPYDEITLKIYSKKANELIDLKNIGVNENNQITYRIEKDGQAKLPNLGWTKLQDLTVRDAQAFLEKEYSTYYTDPFVYISVTNRRVIVFANGSSKGTVIHFSNDNFTLIEALAESGGISDFGKAYKIKLLRGDARNPKIYNFDIRDIKEVKKAYFQILSNDIIYVESRPRYASKVLKELTPYLSLFSSMFTIYILLTKK